MSHAFGAVFDNPGLIVACIIGDGEAETGPIATAWHANKMLDPIGDGTVLPILHLNGFKISNPTVLSRIEPEELEQFLRGCGWTPYFVEGDDPQAMHRLMSDTLDLVVADIAPIGADARASIKSPRPRWPMIVLRPPKGWTGPKTVDGLKNEGTFRAHQVPILVDAAHPGLAIIAGECLAEKDKMPRGRPESLDIGRVVSAGPLRAAIFDVDGVLLASPHERAWREALVGFADPVSFTTAVYQAIVAGKPRLDGACAALKALGVPDAGRQAGDYALCKQARLEALIAGGEVSAFPDALRFVLAVAALGWPMAVASSSKNARAMLRPIRVPDGRSLLDLFAVDVCGCDLRHGKPDPEIFQIAAEELHMNPDRCFVAEDAPAGVEAARAGGMAPLGVARLDDAAGLKAARADLVVASLDDVDLGTLSDGRLCRHAT